MVEPERDVVGRLDQMIIFNRIPGVDPSTLYSLVTFRFLFEYTDIVKSVNTPHLLNVGEWSRVRVILGAGVLEFSSRGRSSVIR
jgi:hypothetical protein